MEFIKGMDLSTLPEVEECGGHFYNKGIESDALSILKEYGANYVRIRLWNDPYSETGEPYGAGTNDLECCIKLAKRVKSQGLKFLLDIHYSDFWADPGKQITPKAWQGMDADELTGAVYEFTYETLVALEKEGVSPDMVAVGNELTNGLLWPLGKVPEYANIARFLSAGIKAVREKCPGVPVMLHLDNGGNNELYVRWFTKYFENGGEDFEYIGLSYYPFWHGDFKALEFNMRDIIERFHKDLIIAEVSMGFTMDDYAEYEKLGPDERKGYATSKELVENLDYPMTKQGQCDFMKRLCDILKSLPENRGCGFFYWEPAWIPVPGSGWANEAALRFTGEKGPGGNEWANQALFDYDGNALPALEVIRNI